MRALLLLLALPLSALAADKPFVPDAGRYAYNNKFELLVKKRYEVAYGFTDQGRALIQKLRAAGYVCENTGREIYRCSGFEPVEGSAREIAGRVAAQLKGVILEFGPAKGEPSFVRKGSSYAEWNVNQEVKFRGKQYSGYRFIISGGVSRIFLGAETAGETFIVSETNGLGYPMDLPVTESRTVYRTYFGLGSFEKK